MFCSNCGNEISDAAKFCKKCGAAQTSTTPHPTVPNTATSTPLNDVPQAGSAPSAIHEAPSPNNEQSSSNVQAARAVTPAVNVKKFKPWVNVALAFILMVAVLIFDGALYKGGTPPSAETTQAQIGIIVVCLATFWFIGLIVRSLGRLFIKPAQNASASQRSWPRYGWSIILGFLILPFGSVATYSSGTKGLSPALATFLAIGIAVALGLFQDWIDDNLMTKRV